MADPPASAPRMCEHTRGNGAGISKSARLRYVTAPCMCERSFMPQQFPARAPFSLKQISSNSFMDNHVHVKVWIDIIDPFSNLTGLAAQWNVEIDK